MGGRFVDVFVLEPYVSTWALSDTAKDSKNTMNNRTTHSFCFRFIFIFRIIFFFFSFISLTKNVQKSNGSNLAYRQIVPVYAEFITYCCLCRGRSCRRSEAGKSPRTMIAHGLWPLWVCVMWSIRWSCGIHVYLLCILENILLASHYLFSRPCHL